MWGSWVQTGLATKVYFKGNPPKAGTGGSTENPMEQQHHSESRPQPWACAGAWLGAKAEALGPCLHLKDDGVFQERGGVDLHSPPHAPSQQSPAAFL